MYEKYLCSKRNIYRLDKYHFFSLRFTVFISKTFLRSGGNEFHNLGYKSYMYGQRICLFAHWHYNWTRCDILVLCV
jgi:hypothetical protein